MVLPGCTWVTVILFKRRLCSVRRRTSGSRGRQPAL